jgi:DNA-binding MarR family transcriptional regulator
VYLDFGIIRYSKDMLMAASRQRLAAELGAAMQAYQRSTQAFDDEVGRQLGLNPADLRCLDWLVDEARSPSELSEATGLSSAATTAMVDRLERKGFVRRTRSVEDRRRVLVEMTEEGRERTGSFYGPLVVDGTALLGRFSADELASMLRHLREIHRSRLRS